MLHSLPVEERMPQAYFSLRRLHENFQNKLVLLIFHLKFKKFILFLGIGNRKVVFLRYGQNFPANKLVVFCPKTRYLATLAQSVAQRVEYAPPIILFSHYQVLIAVLA